MSTEGDFKSSKMYIFNNETKQLEAPLAIFKYAIRLHASKVASVRASLIGAVMKQYKQSILAQNLQKLLSEFSKLCLSFPP